MAIRTVNRKPSSVSIPDVDDYFFVQSDWKGLNDGKNPFTVDQQSFEDCKNVYVDANGLLSVRPSIVDSTHDNADVFAVYKQWYFNDTYVLLGNVRSSPDSNSFPTTLVFYSYEDGIRIERARIVNIYVKPIFVTSKNDAIFVIYREGMHGENRMQKYDVTKQELSIVNDIYVPITKLYVNNIPDDYESENQLTNLVRHRYIYNSNSSVNFSLLSGKLSTISYDDKNFTTILSSYTPNSLFFKSQKLSENEIADDVILGSLNKYKPLISVSEKGNKIYCQYEYVKENGIIIDVLWKVKYTSDDKTFTYYDCPNGVLGMPVISKDGTFIAVLLKDGPWALSVLSTREDGSMEFPEWTNLIEYNGGISSLKSAITKRGYEYDEDINEAGKSSNFVYNRGVGLNCITSNTFAYMYARGNNKVYSNELYCINCINSSFKFSSIHVYNDNSSSKGYFVYDSYDVSKDYDIEDIDPGYYYEYFKFYKNNYIQIDAYYKHDTLYCLFPIMLRTEHEYETMKFYCSKSYYTSDNNHMQFYQLSTLFYYGTYNIPYCIYYDGNNVKINYVMSVGDVVFEKITFTLPILDAYSIAVNTSTVPVQHLTYPAVITPSYAIYAQDCIVTPNNEQISYVGIKFGSKFSIIYNNDVELLDTKNYDFYTNYIGDNSVSIDIVISDDVSYSFDFDCSSLLDSIYASKNNVLYISSDKYENDVFKLYFPKINTQRFDTNICCLHPISQTEMAIFTLNSIYYSSNKEGVYYYFKSKVQANCKPGMNAITTFDGKYVMFNCDRGLTALSYENFVASTEQTGTILSDVIINRWRDFNKYPIRLLEYDFWIICYSTETNKSYVFDTRNKSFWYMEYNNIIKDILRIRKDIELFYTNKDNSSQYPCTILETNICADFGKFPIDWFVTSQKLHFDKPVYRKRIQNIQLNTVEKDDKTTFKLSLKAYRDRNYDNDVETLEYDVDTLRTFVKHCNYLKVNQLQYSLQCDDSDAIQRPFKLSNIIIKYSVTSNVR